MGHRRGRSPSTPATEVSISKKPKLSVHPAPENPVSAAGHRPEYSDSARAVRRSDRPALPQPARPAGRRPAAAVDLGPSTPGPHRGRPALARPDTSLAASPADAIDTGQAQPAGPPSRPGVAAGPAGPVLAQHQIAGLLRRSGPQIPVRYEVGSWVLEKHAGRPLDPEAPVFSTLAEGSCLDDELEAGPGDLDDLWATATGDDYPLESEHPAPGPCRCHASPLGSCPTFVLGFLDTIVQVLQQGKVNMDGARIELDHKQIDPEPWDRLLGSYFDKSELVNALRFGWDFSFTSQPEPRDAPCNLPSAREFATHVDDYIATELKYGAIVGPLPANLPFETFKNPLGTVPKPHCPDKRRVIVDCTQRGHGVNMWIPHDHHRGKEVKTKLPGTTQIVAAIKRTRLRFPGEAIKMWKCDYARFYRQFLSCPSQSPFLCIGWKGETFIDRVWSFGNRGACQSSQRFSSAVCWLFRTQVPPRPGVLNSGRHCRCSHSCGCGDNEAMCYIDDTIGVCAASNAEWLFRSFLNLVQELTLKLSTTPGHISQPSTSCVALGILYNTETNLVSLPEEKLVLLRQMLAVWTTKKVATPKELASLAGKLLWASAVVVPGRVFLGRVLSLKRSADARRPEEARRPITLDQ